ncbi:hypothetical protein Btru_005889 [Bulinus truncatus]|nr:hypothetical protein Btru_005889 [Bulinus truncatus]
MVQLASDGSTGCWWFNWLLVVQLAAGGSTGCWWFNWLLTVQLASDDLLAEQINQSSAARILQELPRYNWLEQKILQKNYNPVPGVVNLSSSQSLESSKALSSRSQVAAATVPVTLTISSKSSPGITCDIQDGGSGLNQKHAHPGYSSEHCPDDSNRKGMQTSHSESELMPLSKFDGSNMTTLSEKPSSLSSDIMSTRSELTSVQPILNYDLCPTSPDDLNEESGLTIDLGHVDDTDCSVSDAMSPAAEVDAEISKASAPSSSTTNLLERPADSPTDCIDQVGLSLVTTSIKQSASSSHLDQLDLTLHPAGQDDRSDEAEGSSAIKLERDDDKTVPSDAAAVGSVGPSDSSVDMTKSSCAASISAVAATTAAFAPEQDLTLSGPDGTTAMTGLMAQRSSSPSLVLHLGRGSLSVRTANTSAALAATTTTTTTTTTNSVLSSPSHNESSPMPLDLCLKRSEKRSRNNSFGSY